MLPATGGHASPLSSGAPARSSGRACGDAPDGHRVVGELGRRHGAVLQDVDPVGGSAGQRGAIALRQIELLQIAAPGRRSALRLRKVGFIFQRFHLLAVLTAAENVMLAGRFARRRVRLRHRASLGIVWRLVGEHKPVGEPPRRPSTLGVRMRLLFAWAAGSCVPLLAFGLWVGKQWTFSVSFMLASLCLALTLGAAFAQTFLFEMPLSVSLLWPAAISGVWIVLLLHPTTKRFAGLEARAQEVRTP